MKDKNIKRRRYERFLFGADEIGLQSRQKYATLTCSVHVLNRMFEVNEKMNCF